MSHQGFIPPHILHSISQHAEHEELKSAATNTLTSQQAIFSLRQEDVPGFVGLEAAVRTDKNRFIYDAAHQTGYNTRDFSLLRKEGSSPVYIPDDADEAYDNTGKVYDFYASVFKWKSLDNHNMPLVSIVRYGEKFMNAFWSDAAQAMFFGEGDSNLIWNFTGSLDVIAHEMTHAVISNINPLNYRQQSGALNESFADVMGITMKHYYSGKTNINDVDWIIGSEVISDTLKSNPHNKGLRSMKAPGTAYDDPQLGKDPQPDHFNQYSPLSNGEDNGGVHIYSGIPNKAFYLVATELQKNSWEIAAPLWWHTLQETHLSPNATFVDFANATVETAKVKYDTQIAGIVTKAWEDVGVLGRR